MKIFATFASLAVAASFGAPASAQTHRETICDLSGSSGIPVQTVSDINAYGALPSFEVLTIVRSMGFEPQSQPVLRGRVYIVRAFDDQDIPVLVAVDARTGHVLNVAERPTGRFGQVVEERYGAYPMPPGVVPNGSVYGARSDRDQDYRDPPYRTSGTTTYSPEPYAPSVAPRAVAPRPRVASRTPAVTPTPVAKPKAATTAAAPETAKPVAAAPATTPAPQGAATQTTPPATATVAQDTGRRGTSIPAPVASRKVATPPEETPAAKPAEPQASAPQANSPLVPVAPLE